MSRSVHIVLVLRAVKLLAAEDIGYHSAAVHGNGYPACGDIICAVTCPLRKEKAVEMDIALKILWRLLSAVGGRLRGRVGVVVVHFKVHGEIDYAVGVHIFRAVH